MKRTLKIALLAFLATVGIIALLALFIQLKPLPNYADEVAIPELTITPTPELLALGEKIVSSDCAGCHGSESHKLEGMLNPELDVKPLGTIYNSNITQHETDGIGSYSDGELYRLLRTGVKKDGALAFPMMPRLALMAEEDVHAIIAFLKSDHPMVAPSPVGLPDSEPSFLARMLFTVEWAPTPYQEPVPQGVDEGDAVAWGKHLITTRYYCYICHSANPSQANILSPELTPNYLNGGYRFLFASHEIDVPSITMNDESMVRHWSEEEFVGAVKWGQRPGGKPYVEPMHPYTLVDTSEIQAMWAYLKTLN
ncbi:MAG: cytochrome c [Bacteroidota bacterium]